MMVEIGVKVKVIDFTKTPELRERWGRVVQEFRVGVREDRRKREEGGRRGYYEVQKLRGERDMGYKASA